MGVFPLTLVKTVLKKGFLLKFSVQKFCWFGKSVYLCTRFPNEGGMKKEFFERFT